MIERILPLNSVVSRIETNGNYKIDVYNPSFPCTEGDVVDIRVSKEVDLNMDYIMHGTVYFVDNQVSCISAGGLLCSIPQLYDLNADIYISISKSRKSKRALTDLSSKKKKLK